MMITRLALLSILASALLPRALADNNPQIDPNLREEYHNASPGQRAEIRARINAQRQAKIVERFDTEGDGQLNLEEYHEAFPVLRQEWERIQAARDAAVEQRKQEVRDERTAALLHRFDTNRDGLLSDEERARAMETIRREQEAHRARRELDADSQRRR